MDSFRSKDPVERKAYTFTLSDLTETITSVVFEIDIKFPNGAVDTTPLVADGSCFVAGNSLIQHFKNGTDGITYHLRAIIDTDLGNTYVGSALLPVARK
jgi:hypothetical protein